MSAMHLDEPVSTTKAPGGGGVTFTGDAEGFRRVEFAMQLKIQLDSTLDTHQKKCSYLSSMFRGSALDWLISQHASNAALFNDYEEFVALVKEVFELSDAAQTTKRENNLARHRIRAGHVREDVLQFESYCDALQLDSTVRKIIFPTKLPAALVESIINNDDPSTYKEWRDNAVQRDEVHKATHGTTTAPKTTKKKKAKTKCTKCGRTNHTTANCYAKSVNVIRARGSSGVLESMRIHDLPLQGKRMSALLDSGADVSCIRANMVVSETQPSNVTLYGATGQPFAVNVPFILETIDNIPQKLYLVKDLAEEVILGRAYLDAVTPLDVLSIDTYQQAEDGGRLRLLSHLEQQTLDDEIDDLLSKGVIRPSRAPVSTNVLFVPKKNGKLRLCVDYRPLNAVTRKDSYPLPLLQDVLQRARQHSWFTVLDIEAAFHHVRIKKGDEWKTAFKTSRGMFEYTRMPFGVTNGPSTFQRYVDSVLRDFHQFCIAYIDDVLVYADTQAECEERSRKVLAALKEDNLRINDQKAQWVKQDVTLLGVRVTPEFVEPIQDFQAILDWPEPTNKKELQSWLGLLNYWAPFIPLEAQAAQPLYRLTGKDQWNWDNAARMSFAETRQAAVNTLRLNKFLSHQPSWFQTDASQFAVGAILMQEHGPVAIISRSLKPAERNYTTTERELLAIVYAVQKWRHYLESTREKVTIFTDHQALTQTLNSSNENRRINRWALLLSQYQLTYEFLPGKDNPADYPSRRADYAREYGSSTSRAGGGGG